MKYKLVYAYESLANFPNTEHPDLFDSPQEAFKWAKENLNPEYVKIVEEVE
jgi:hypothetical protein